jgi:hypothetical protein
MKKTKQVSNGDKLSFKVLDLLRIIKEEYTEFYKTEETDKKINHMMEVMFGTFLYVLSRYDYRNLMKFIQIETKEGIDNGHE